MLKIFFTVQIYYLKTLFIAKNRHSNLSLAAESLLANNTSIYRLSAIEKNKPHISLKVALRILKRLFATPINKYQNKSGTLVILDEVNTKENEKRITFIEKITHQKIHTFLSKEELVQYHLSPVLKGLIILYLCFNLLWLLPLCIISKKRMYYAQYLYFIIESFLSIYFSLKNKCKKVVMSCIYSQDSNINYLLFKHFNIEVIKNPSEDALAFDNQILLTDGLIVCNPYQVEEIADLKYVKVKYLIHGFAEQSLDYYTKYEKYYPSESHVIGYYSSGSWLRKQQSMNYTHQGIDCAEQEENLLIELKYFLQRNSMVKLRIFLHPVEKRNDETIKKVNNYMASILENVNYDFASFDTPTCLNFEACNVAISLFSGASLYRLNFGYKSLYYVPKGSFPFFPTTTSSIEKINIGTKEFNLFLSEVLNLEDSLFIKQYNLESYLYKNQIKFLGNTRKI